MPHCQECKHYKATNDGPYCFKSSGHPKPISPIMVKDCFEERPAGEPASTAPAEKPGYVPRTKVCAKCGRELPLLQFSTNRRMKDGHQSECKECVAKAGKKSRARLNEKKRAEREKAAQAELASGVKVCRKCGRELPISAFGKGHSTDGLQAFCKECKAEQGRAALAKRWAKEADAVRDEARAKETVIAMAAWTAVVQAQWPVSSPKSALRSTRGRGRSWGGFRAGVRRWPRAAGRSASRGVRGRASRPRARGAPSRPRRGRPGSAAPGGASGAAGRAGAGRPSGGTRGRAGRAGASPGRPGRRRRTGRTASSNGCVRASCRSSLRCL